MGEVCQYHITMLITGEQEDVIRSTFRDRNWPCWIKVLSDENVAGLIQNGFSEIFPILTEGQDGGIGHTVFTEIKSEIVDIENEEKNTEEVENATEDVDKLENSNKPPTWSENEDTMDYDMAKNCDKDNVKVKMEDNSCTAEITPLRNSNSENKIHEKETGFSNNSLQKRNKTGSETDTVGVDRLQCEICDFPCVSETVLQDHYKIMHQEVWCKLDNSSTAEITPVKSPRNSNSGNTIKEKLTGFLNKRLGKRKNKTALDTDTDDSGGRLQCEFCEVSCVSKTVLRRHCKNMHQDIWCEFDCPDCESRFKTKEELWEHRRQAKHEPREPRPFPTEKLKQTPEELLKMGQLQCSFCSHFYLNKRSLRRHTVNVHRKWLLWNCAVCFEGFKSRDELNAHKREKQHKSSKWVLGNHQCDSCGKIYSRPDSFREHKLTCKKTPAEIMACRTYPCDICGLAFKSQIRVKAHKRNVHVDEPVICHVCGTVCKNKRALLVHRRRHDMKNKKYRCENCGKSFFNSTLLEQHVRTHSKEKPYKCPVCPYTCAIRQNIHKHSKKVHKVQYKAIDLTKLKQGAHAASDFSVFKEEIKQLGIGIGLDTDSNDMTSQMSKSDQMSTSNQMSTSSKMSKLQSDKNVSLS